MANIPDPSLAAETFAALLRRHRTSVHLSQRALADRAGISLQAIAALENGRRQAPYRDTLQRLSAALNLSQSERSAFYQAAERKPHDTAIARARSGSTNLPRQLTSLVGRAGTIAEIQSLLRLSPLVTITGTGGVGKTTVAVRAAMRDLPRWKDGVWFVSLANAREPTFVLDAIASVLRIPESLSMSTSDAIVSYLKGRRLLLVLDNCEHLITEVRLAVTTLLQASVGVTVLAISRESLQLRGERVYRVPSLAFPSETNQSAQEALRYESVTLFVERARAAEPRFRLTDANAPAVVTICRRLDGVPLAIELAASKMVTLSPIELATRLNERFDVLKSSNAGLVPRQQTVNAMIGWSYELLSKREQRVLQCAALFPSDFGLDAALAICRPEETSESEVLEDLSSLVRKSLVASEVLEDNVRYRLLESVAAFAQDHLPADERESLSRRYAEFYCQRAESLERDCYVVAEQDWIRQAKAEIRHFRAALERSFGAHGDVVTGQRLVGALWPVWAAFAVAEGLRWNRVASGLLEADTPLQVRLQVLLANAQLYGTLGKHSDSFEAAEAALELGAKVPNEIALVRALQNSGSALAALGHGDRGIAYLKAALERAENLGKTRLVSFICNALGSAYFRCGDLIAARQAYSRALSESDAIGAERLAANIATNLAELEYSAGDPSAALVIVRKALARHQTLGNRRVAALCMSNLAKYIVALGRNEEGVTSATDAVKEAVAVEDAALTTWSLQHLAAAVALRKNTTEIAEVDASTAARLLAFVDTSLSKLSLLRDREEEQEYTSASAAIRTVLSSASLDALTAEGASWTLDRAVLEALHFEP